MGNADSLRRKQKRIEKAEKNKYNRGGKNSPLQTPFFFPHPPLERKRKPLSQALSKLYANYKERENVVCEFSTTSSYLPGLLNSG